MMKTFNDSQVITRLRRLVAATSYRKASLRLGVSAGYVSDIVKGRRKLTETVAERLGFTEVPAMPAPRKWKLKGARPEEQP